MEIVLSTRLRDVLEYAVRGAPQAMKDELQRLLAAPDEVARMRTALEAAETQALAEMDRVYGEAVDYNMLARSLERLRADNTRLRARIDVLERALAAAPGHDEIWPGITGAEHFIELALEWYDGERTTALGLEGE